MTEDTASLALEYLRSIRADIAALGAKTHTHILRVGSPCRTRRGSAPKAARQYREPPVLSIDANHCRTRLATISATAFRSSRNEAGERTTLRPSSPTEPRFRVPSSTLCGVHSTAKFEHGQLLKDLKDALGVLADLLQIVGFDRRMLVLPSLGGLAVVALAYLQSVSPVWGMLAALAVAALIAFIAAMARVWKLAGRISPLVGLPATGAIEKFADPALREAKDEAARKAMQIWAQIVGLSPITLPNYSCHEACRPRIRAGSGSIREPE
jgi:hypothetical protein